MDRRLFIGSSIATAALVGNGVALAQPAEVDVEVVSIVPPLPVDLAAKATQQPAPYTETEWVGTAPPTRAEIDLAYQILRSAPFGVAPVEVASYFLAVGSGAYGSQYRQFAREWPERANPVIFHFFAATQTKPEGDQTAWCAAFVNWCILRGLATSADEIGKAPGSFSVSGKQFLVTNVQNRSTNHASSGSFRCWQERNPLAPGDIAPRVRGDIAVFKDAGTDGMTAQCRGTGHVAFYLETPREGWVRVLGGNQTQAGSGGAVTVTDMRSNQGSRFMKIVGLK